MARATPHEGTGRWLAIGAALADAERLPLASRVAGLGLLACSAALYLHDLGSVPAYLGLDEAHFGVHAWSLAESGRNLNGDRFPLFVSLADPLGDHPVLPWGTTWYQPVLFYLIAIALKVLPFSEGAIRTPTALIGGLVNVWLVYAVAHRVLKNRWWGVLAAAMLSLCPAHVILSRQALDYILPVPLVLGWLWCVVRCVDTGRVGYALAGGALLGAGCYSYVTAWVMMPFYLALSWMLFRRAHPRPLASSVAAAAGYGLPLALMVPWVASHPEMPGQILAQYQVADGAAVSVFQAAGQGLGVWAAVRMALSHYWDCFNPSFLFLEGGATLSVSTRLVGVLLLPLAVFLPVGLYTLWRRRAQDGRWLVLLLGVLTAPIPPALKGTPFAIQRMTTFLPFAVLASVVGLSVCWRSRHRPVRIVTAVLVLAMPLQFAGFYRDYLTDYRLRSARAADPTAFRETAGFLLRAEAAGRIPAFYLTAPLYDVSAKWRFYTTMAGRPDLLQRTKYFTGRPSGLRDVAVGSLMVVEIDSPTVDALVETGDWSLARIVTDVGGRPSLAVLRRERDG